jgi:predicted enzyme related to lactoylglutathione lyase
MPRPVHFEIHASDPEALAGFYRPVFDWEVKTWEGPIEYWLCTTGPDGEMGINGAITKREGPDPGQDASIPVNGCVNTIGVSDIDAVTEKAQEYGAVIAMPKAAVPGVGWLTYLKDPAGNLVGVLQPDMSAS